MRLAPDFVQEDATLLVVVVLDVQVALDVLGHVVQPLPMGQKLPKVVLLVVADVLVHVLDFAEGVHRAQLLALAGAMAHVVELAEPQVVALLLAIERVQVVLVALPAEVLALVAILALDSAALLVDLGVVLVLDAMDVEGVVETVTRLALLAPAALVVRDALQLAKVLVVLLVGQQRHKEEMRWLYNKITQCLLKIGYK